MLDDVTADPEGVRPVTAALRLLWRLTRETVRICLRYRVTGLAAEAGFFALLSLPPLILGLVGSLGYIGDRLGADVVQDLRARVSEFALAFLTPDAVSTLIVPTFDEVTRRGRIDIISIGFVLSLWSGSRALNVYVDTISIMYGLSGHRGIVRTRVLSFTLYVAALLVGVVVIPLVLIGPGLLAAMLAGTRPAADRLVRPVRGAVLAGGPVLAVIGLATLYQRGPADPDAVEARPARGAARPGAVVPGQPGVPGGDQRVGERQLDLRPAVHADPGADLALPVRDRGADRGRAERRGGRALAASHPAAGPGRRRGAPRGAPVTPLPEPVRSELDGGAPKTR